MNNKNNKPEGYIRPGGRDPVEAWGWPRWRSNPEIQSNALGLGLTGIARSRRTRCRQKSSQEPTPSITAEEVEAIRQAAWEEGLASRGASHRFCQGARRGKLEGLAAGSSGRSGSRAVKRGWPLSRTRWSKRLPTGSSHVRLATPSQQEAGRGGGAAASAWSAAGPRPHSPCRGRDLPKLLLENTQAGPCPAARRRAEVTLMLHGRCGPVEQAFGAEECAKRHWRLQNDPPSRGSAAGHRTSPASI